MASAKPTRYAAGQCGNIQILLIRMNIGPDNARHATEYALEAFPLYPIIAGFACALKPCQLWI